MAMRLTKENVRFLLVKTISDCELFMAEGKEAEALCNYLSGATDMANEVMKAIEELGGT